MSINDYICFALFIKLIVNNVKYGGIHYDYGQLTNTFFLILVTLQDAVQQDSVFSDDINKDHCKALVNKNFTGKGFFKVLVCNAGNGNIRIPDIKTLSCNELKNSEQKGKGIIFGFRFILNQSQKPLLADQPFLFIVNNFVAIQKANTVFLSEYGDGQINFEYNTKAGLLHCKMSKFKYGYYKNDLTTKRITPERFNNSREKLAIRACDLLRFLTISFLTTKSEKNNSLTSTVCNNCFIAVDCNCEPFEYDVSGSMNQKRERRLRANNQCL